MQLKEYFVEIPDVDSSKTWITIKSFDTKDRAIAFTKKIWGAENGYLSLISEDGDEWVVDVPNPNYTSTNNKFLNVEGFHHEADALDFAIENYQANEEGCVNLIYEI